MVLTGGASLIGDKLAHRLGDVGMDDGAAASRR
jgi:hypothetical protein